MNKINHFLFSYTNVKVFKTSLRVGCSLSRKRNSCQLTARKFASCSIGSKYTHICYLGEVTV